MATGSVLATKYAREATPKDSTGNYAIPKMIPGGLNELIPSLYFADSGDSADFPLVMPAYYDAGGLTAKIYWTDATTTGATFRIGFRRYDASITATHSYSFQSVVASALGGANEIGTAEISFTDGQIDGFLAGESGSFRLDINSAVDAWVLAVVLTED